MPHVDFEDAGATVAVQHGAVVSRVIHRDDTLNVTVFGSDAGEGLTEHKASQVAVVQVLSGRIRFTADDEAIDAGPGFWVHMTAGTPHSLTASEPTVLLLTLIRP